MESRILELFKKISLVTYVLSIGAALFFSDIPAVLRWGGAILFFLTGGIIVFKYHSFYDEREAYICYVSSWASAVLAMTLIMAFCIMDGLRLGHSDPKFVWLLVLWGATSGLVFATMKGKNG